jgi:hypothetical protein
MPVLSSQRSPRFAPQVGQANAATCFGVRSLAFMPGMMRLRKAESWSILNNFAKDLLLFRRMTTGLSRWIARGVRGVSC